MTIKECRTRYYKKHKEGINKINKEYREMKMESKAFFDNIVMPTLKRKYNNQCQKCGSKNHLDIHHTDYEHANINNLELLCRKCHKAVHKRSRCKNG